MSARKVYAVDQGEGIYVTGTFRDVAGVGIAFAELLTLTLTLYNADSPDNTTANKINNRNAQTVLPGVAGGTVNSVTVGANGEFVYDSPGADHPMLSLTRETERHTALFKFTYGTAPTREGRHEIDFRVRRVRRAD